MANPNRTRPDGCPECMAHDNAPTRTETVPNGVQCHYRCACGCEWITSWWGEDD